ncbi:MAG TPA: PAS domain S-box protein, partial [Terriglobales bacterium]|nr:PAS domain S-box protein [Terriglobales bacterium]
MKNKKSGAAAPTMEQPHFLKQIFEMLPPSNLIYADKDLIIRYVNQTSLNTFKKIENLLPCKASEVVGKCIDIFHKDPARVRQMLANPRSLPHHGSFELGTEKIAITAHAVYDEKGDHAGYMASWAIVTEQDRLQQGMDAIYRSRPCVEYNLAGNVVRANDLFLQLMGYTFEEVQGKHHDSFLLERDRNLPENKALWEKLMASTPQHGEFRRVGKGNKEFWVATNYYPIPDHARRVYRVMQFLTDITARKLRDADYEGQIGAISSAQPVSEYDMNGIVLHANENFEKLFGYSHAEMIGQHISMFVDAATRQSPEYKAQQQTMWEKLKRGEHAYGEAKRATKQGKEIWIEYSYHPILDLDGKPCKIVNYMKDITEQKATMNELNANFVGQIKAIRKSQAVIEFNMEGVVLDANENFLDVLGYTLDEIKGKNHAMFVDEGYRRSPEYKEFWAKLSRGEYVGGEFRRIGKSGNDIWIQASYNPIMDLNGKPFKVVKYATDVTAQKLSNADFSGQIAAIGKSQAVIEFNMDGTVRVANENFLKTLGYTLDEIKGKHHGMFVDEGYRHSTEYKEFWAKLNQGEYVAGEFRRIGKGGKEVWIQASYNPILDLNGKPFKVVKYASDITQQKSAVNAIAGHIDKISRGEIPQKMTADYGEFNLVRDNVNTCIDNVKSLVADTATLAIAAVEGRLSTRADASKHGGDYRKIIEGINETLDAVIAPLHDVSKVLDKVAAGDMTVRMEGNYAGDFKALCEALNKTVHQMHAALQMIASNTNSVASAAEELSATSQQITANSEETTAQAKTVAEAGTQVNTNLQTLSSGAEEMNSTIGEIAKNATEAAKVATEAVTAAESTNQTVGKLGESSAEIGKVIEVITSIAQQTNLLALNATIEAARA